MEIKVYYNGIGNKIPMWYLIQEDNWYIYFQYEKDFLSIYWNISPKELEATLNYQWPFPDYLDYLPWIIYDCLPDWWWKLVMDRYIEEKFNIDISDAHIFLKLLLLDDNAIWWLSFEPKEDLKITPIELPNLSWIYSMIKDFYINSEHNSENIKTLLLASASLNGARPKILCFYYNNNWNIKISNNYFNNSEPYIIKFNSENDSNYSLILEYVYMLFAKQLWEDTPHIDLLEMEKWEYALAIKRFDRIKTNNGFEKLLMHSLAGSLHTNFRFPSFNYDWFLKMTWFMTQSYTEVELAYERCVFNIIFGNKDDHTKNFSYVFTKNNRWVLSPSYDLTPNNWLNWHHQMDVLWKTDNITKNDLINLWKKNDIKNPEQIINKISNLYKDMIIFLKGNYKDKIPKSVISKLEQNYFLN
jgi:serine/threonine-protein kinase HipA